MEALEQLEGCIEELLSRHEILKRENSRLKADMAVLMQEKAVLAQENHSLHAKIAQVEALRAEARQRIEALLQKIRDHDSVG